MSLRARTLKTAAALATMTALAVPSLAAAAVDSKVTLKVGKSGAKFKGKVTSSSPECVVGRKVVLIRIDPDGKTQVAKTFASESGKFAAKVPMQAGNRFFAKLKSYESPPGTLCRSAKSDVLTV